ncbi:MAG: ATP-binding protein [Gammaproteobacteria bacterium]|nr:ATP-binding protein [Gammaproteobacteria bacterium]
MINSLYKKLALVLLTVTIFLGAAFIGTATMGLPVFLQELNQRLHQDLAKNLVKETRLFTDTEVNEQDWNKVFMGLMLVNPAIEVYLVDKGGKILSYSAPPGHVKQTAVDLEPIRHFIDGDTLPISGVDPRSIDRQKVFSAAPIYENNQIQGYLYVVLGGEIYDSIATMLQSSYVSRFSIAAVFGALLLALLGGLFTFKFITRRINNLSDTMNDFKHSDFQHEVVLDERFDGRPGDEIDQLGRTFREMSERIIQQVKLLQHSDASRRELVANVSHDLRTPLASMQGYLETLSLKRDELSAQEQQHYINIAFKHSQRLGKLISELFELSMLDSNANSLHFEPFSMTELAHDIAQKFQLAAKEKQIKLKTDISQQTPFVKADIALIERVLENLIENAIKYTQSGGSVELAVHEESGQVIFSVEDNGPGIPDTDIPHIFDRFYRVDKSRDESQNGTGLGLAITKRILQLHGSAVNVESILNKGTKFMFPLPEYQYKQIN